MMESVQGVENLADNWCHDYLKGEHYTSQDAIYQLVVQAYTAGYEQAWSDAKEALGA